MNLACKTHHMERKEMNRVCKPSTQLTKKPGKLGCYDCNIPNNAQKYERYVYKCLAFQTEIMYHVMQLVIVVSCMNKQLQSLYLFSQPPWNNWS